MTAYSADLTGGPLFKEEFDALLAKYDLEDFLAGSFSREDLLINAEAAKQRISQEIRKRILQVSDENFWELYKRVSSIDQKVMLFYVAVKTYQVLMDFVLEVLCERWKTFNTKVAKSDFEYFLDKKRSTHPELDEWTPSTTRKVTNVVFLILRQAEILKLNKLRQVDFSSKVKRYFVDKREVWFLEIMLVSKKEIEDLR